VPRQLAEALDRALSERSGRTTLGARLRKIVGRRFNDAGLRLERAGENLHTGGVLWRVEVDDPSTITRIPDGAEARPSLRDLSG